MKIMAASKVILILENPFLISLIALLTIGEGITKHEILVFILATVGIILISQDEPEPEKKSFRPRQKVHHPNEYDWERDIYGVAFALAGACVSNFGIVAIRQLQLKRDTVDPVIISMLIAIFGCFINPIGLLTAEVFDIYRPVEYSLNLEIGLVIISCSYAIGTIFSHQMFYLMKASWARVALNMQVAATFMFDIFVAQIHFNKSELIGCVLLFVANFYLIVVQVLGDDEEPRGRQSAPVVGPSRDLYLDSEPASSSQQTPAAKHPGSARVAPRPPHSA